MIQYKNDILAKNKDLMHTYDEKISLICEMIAFAVVDGKLHNREYDFLWLVANELNIEKAAFDELFHSEIKPIKIKSEFQRIQQFYRLALLMRCDGIMHEKEEIAIRQIAIDMGLNPSITKRVLQMIKESPTGIVDPTHILDAFRAQHN